MRELIQEEKDQLYIIWNSISKGKADSIDDKVTAIKFYNYISGSRYKHNTNCGACLRTVYIGLKELYDKYYGK